MRLRGDDYSVWNDSVNIMNALKLNKNDYSIFFRYKFIYIYIVSK
jgi:hypothetical protein